MIIGIDPGINGGVAFLSADRLDIFDIPVIESFKSTRTKSGNYKKRREVDCLKLDRLLSEYSHEQVELIIMEKVAAMPGQGVSSMFSFGQSVGRIEGVIMPMYPPDPIVYVSPIVWKKYHGLLKTEKYAAVELCRQKYPGLSDSFLKSKDGRADAVLIAEYGRSIKKGC